MQLHVERHVLEGSNACSTLLNMISAQCSIHTMFPCVLTDIQYPQEFFIALAYQPEPTY